MKFIYLFFNQLLYKLEHIFFRFVIFIIIISWNKSMNENENEKNWIFETNAWIDFKSDYFLWQELLYLSYKKY